MFFKSTNQKQNVNLSTRDQLEFFLKKNSVQFECENNLYRLYINGKNTTWRLGMIIDDERKVLFIRSLYPFTVADAKKSKIAELIVRLNSNIVLGCFNMDYAEGEVTFNMAHFWGKTEMDHDSIERLFFIQIRTVDDMFQLFAEVNFGEGEPALLALQLYEGDET